MTRPLTIVMYHYVRNLRQSRYPEIKGLTTDKFVRQLDFIEKHYTVVGVDMVVSALTEAGCDLPTNAALLTFDDGYRDHYETVFPILRARGHAAAFFPPAGAILEGRILDVNKIHFVLACEPDKEKIVRAIDQEVVSAASEFGLATPADYHEQYAKPSRWDTPEVVYIKSMLQKGLPDALRRAITDRLFARFVTRDAESFARELYMSVDELREMRETGMYVGGHGYLHLWLDTLDRDRKEEEVAHSIRLMTRVGTSSERWVFCYPYGAHDAELLAVLEQYDCAAGLTTCADIADLDRDAPLLLPRLDTNDLPQ